jgi:hypothetical protein
VLDLHDPQTTVADMTIVAVTKYVEIILSTTVKCISAMLVVYTNKLPEALFLSFCLYFHIIIIIIIIIIKGY